MVGVKDRLRMLFEIRGENRKLLRDNYSDAKKDREGRCLLRLLVIYVSLR